MKARSVLVQLSPFLLVAVIVILAYLNPQPSYASQKADTNCDYVSTAGNIDTYYCVDSYNNFEFYINSVGFMMPKPKE